MAASTTTVPAVTGILNPASAGALTGTTFTASTKFLAPDGTAAAPAYSFTNGATSGLFFVSGDSAQMAVGGVAELRFAGGGTNLAAASTLGWGSSGVNTADVLLNRDAAAVLALKNGANAQTFRIYGTTTGPKYASFGHDGTNAVIDTAASSGLVSIAPTNATSVSIGKKVSSYNGITTAGLGAVVVVAAARATAQAAANASVATFTVGASDASFEVSANVLVTTATTHNFSVTCAYTDEGSTARTLTFNFSSLAGVLSTAIINTGGTVPYEGVPMHIRCKTATAITIATTGTFTNVAYNVEGIIKQTA